MNKALEAAQAVLPGLDWRESAKDEASATVPAIGDGARLILTRYANSELPWQATLTAPEWDGWGDGATPAEALASLRVALYGNPPDVLRRWVALGGDLEEWKP